MKIGFSFVDLAMGGAQTYLVQLAQGLAERGHRLQYYLYARRDDPVHTSPDLLLTLDAVAQVVPRTGDLIHNDILQLDGYHSLRKKLPYLFSLRRCVETFHSEYSIRHSGPIYAQYRVANSKAVQQLIRPPSHLIYQGIPIPPPSRLSSKSYDVAILGRIHPVKGHLIFLKACEHLYTSRRKLVVLMIGGYPDHNVYRQKVENEIIRLRSLGINIHLTGDIPFQEVTKWLDQARLLMVTSQSEGFGRMAAEAMACGLPVIANPVGGLLEIIRDGKNGYLTVINDPSSFARLANLLLDDEQLCQTIGQQGRAWVAENYSYQAMLDSYEALYQEVLEQ